MSAWKIHETQGEHSPFPLEGFACVVVYNPKDHLVGNKVYIHGGIGKWKSTSDPKQIYVLDIPNVGELNAKWQVMETIGNEIPRARWNHTLTYFPALKKMILFGGECAPLKTHDHGIYELCTEFDSFTWNKVETTSSVMYEGQQIKPCPRAYHAACAHGQQSLLYIFGGFNNPMDECLGDLWCLDVSTYRWKLLSSFQPETEEEKAKVSQQIKRQAHPTPRYGHTMVMSSKNDALYVIGGIDQNQNPSKEIWKFDLSKKRWELMSLICADEPEEKPLDRKKSIFRAKTESFEKSEIVSKQDIINYYLPFYIPSEGGAACMFGDMIIMYGGYLHDSAVDPVLKDLVVFNTKTNELTKVAIGSEETAVAYHGMTLCSSRLFVFGGNGWSKFNTHALSLNISTSPQIAKVVIPPRHRVVGINLDQLMKRYENTDQPYPTVYSRIIQELYQKGLETEGLFRIPGAGYAMDDLQVKLELGEPVKEVDFSLYDDYTLAGFLKLLFRELPEPIIPFQFYDQLLAIYDKEPEKKEEQVVKELQAIISQIPEVNKNLLFAVLNLFVELTKREEKTRMTPDAVARSVAYSFIRTDDKEKETQIMMRPDHVMIKTFAALVRNATKLTK
jgi:N-acetylneuraminic acid mutarotase